MPTPTGDVSTATASGLKEFLKARLAGVQTTNVGAGDHVKFDTVEASRGTGISIDTATAYVTTIGAASIGRITLKAGRTYRLVASVPFVTFSGITGTVDIGFYDATANAQIGGTLTALTVTNAGNLSGSHYVDAIFAPTADTLIEVRLLNVTALTSLGANSGSQKTHCAVFVETL